MCFYFSTNNNSKQTTSHLRAIRISLFMSSKRRIFSNLSKPFIFESYVLPFIFFKRKGDLKKNEINITAKNFEGGYKSNWDLTVALYFAQSSKYLLAENFLRITCGVPLMRRFPAATIPPLLW